MELPPSHNCSFSTEQMENQLDSLPEIINGTWSIFQKIGMHFVHLNINSLLSKKDEIRYIAKPTNATVIGLNKTKLNNAVLSSELGIEGYDLVKFNRFGRGQGVACFVKNYYI